MSTEKRRSRATYIPRPMGTFEDLEMGQAWSPYVNMAETGDRLIIVAELPGVAMEDISIEVKANVLVLRGLKADLERSEKRRYYCMERCHGGFYREIVLPWLVDFSSARAVLQEGLLQIILKKMEDRRGQAYRIPVHKKD